MTAIRDDLRGEMKRLRLHPIKWGNPRGLTQRELADRTGTSLVWVRQIESGYKNHASPNTLGLICHTLGITARWLKAQKYNDIADIVAEWEKARVLSRDSEPYDPVSAAEQDYLRDAPMLTETEKEQLVEALRGIRREEPLGKDLWRRRGA